MQPMGSATAVRAHAKPSGGTRWLTELAPADHRRYACLVGRVAAKARAPGSADLAPQHASGIAGARTAWRVEVRARAAALRNPVLVRSDVEACYPSIGPEALGRGLARLGARDGQIHALLAFLEAVQAVGTPGLPVGPRPSARLADSVLSVADEAVRRTGACIVRWVDDVVLLADGRLAAGRALDAWAAALAELGLRPHEGKTFTRAGDGDGLLAIVGGTSAAHRGCAWQDRRAVRTLYRAARVHTLGHPPSGDWLLVDGRHVQRVGAGEPPQADRVVELPGATIVPGFVDAHVHLTSTGLSLSMRDVEAATSREELLALARGRAAGDPEPVVLLQGFDETRWGDPAFPSLEELDAVTDRPLVLARADGHVAVANSAALTFAQALEAEGCDRDEQGRPTGRVTSEANRRISRWAAETRTEHRIEELQLDAAGLAASRGITCVHEMAMPGEHGFRDVEVFLRHREKLPVHGIAVVATMDVPRAVELGLRAIGGDLAADGSIGARTAALTEPYLDGGRGVCFFHEDELAGFFRDGHDAGLQVGMHAIGDRAIEHVLRAWERVYRTLDSRERRHFRARRHRIEHFELASPEQVERAAVLGLAASVQPAFDAAWGFPGGLYERAIGPERAFAMNPFRTMLERGLEVGAGSDAPVTPLDPWLAVAALETHHDPAQRLTRLEAIRLHTVGGARLGHHDEKKGVLEAGAHADFAAYDLDPSETEEVRGLRPILTVSLGREVYAA
jgi:predicted amidohydrolase YtcJ